MKIGRSYKQHGISGKFDAIVVGSGIGGLATAALLAKHGGRKVLVLERHYTAGGFTHTFTRPGYEWDVGVHYIGQTQPHTLLRKTFDEVTDGALQWADMGSIYDTFVVGEDRYELPAGRENWRRAMHTYFPNDHRAIDTYLKYLRECAQASRLFFAEKALPDMLSVALGPLMRWPLMKFAGRTTQEVLSSLTSNRRLHAVLAGHYGDYGLPPAQSSFFIQALVAHHYLRGGAYPVGGSSRIAATIVPLIEAEGGAVMTSAEVSEVLVEKGRAVGVRLFDGAEHRAPIVVSDAGVATTFNRLVPQNVSRRLGFARAVARVEPSVAHASLYLGFQKTAAELGLNTSNVWVYPHEDHDAAFTKFQQNKDAPLPVAYLSFPSAKDPSFEKRHPGRATVEVVTLAPYAWFKQWEDSRWKKRGDAYEAMKQNLTDKMLQALFQQCPQLEGQVDHCELSSPLSTRHFANFSQGEIYGLAHTPGRFKQRWLKPRTRLPGLYLTGADVCTAGVGGALFGGVLTASALLGQNLPAKIAKRTSQDVGIVAQPARV